MVAAGTVEAFLDVMKRSAVIDPGQLNRYLDGLRRREGLPPRPEDLAQLLIKDGLLTRFQTQQFLAGRWKGLTVGKYQLLEQIGRGKTGHIYLGKDPQGQPVAVKILPPARQGGTTFRRFEREARAGASLDHPNIVKQYDFDRDDDVCFLVMEYVEGVTLRDLVKRAGPLDPLRVAHYIRQAALGLQHVHEAGLIHRDIEPANLLLDRQGTVKILDLGLARFESDVADQLTMQQGTRVLGTADFMAPEQVSDGHGVDIRADIYGLGATFYYLLAGRAPFPDGPLVQKLLWTQTREPDPLSEVRPGVPEVLEAVITKMMRKDPNTRYQQPSEVVEALKPWTRSPVAPPTEYIPRRGETTSSLTGTGPQPALTMPVLPPTTKPSSGRGGPLPGLLPPRERKPRPGLFWPLTFLLLLLLAGAGLGFAVYVSLLGP